MAKPTAKLKKHRVMKAETQASLEQVKAHKKKIAADREQVLQQQKQVRKDLSAKQVEESTAMQNVAEAEKKAEDSKQLESDSAVS